jgi:phage terminase large subunit-like protein
MAKVIPQLTTAEKVILFIETYCRVPEGSKVGSPLKLAPFQKKFIKDIYDNPEGTRRAYLSIARKNGKTGLIAGLLLAHICGPVAIRNSQIISGAMSRDQAALVFNLASKMITMNPDLNDLCRVVQSGKKIIGLAKNVEYKALAADGTTAHGLSPVLAILDEVGQIRGPSSEFVEAITTSQGAHDHPLLIVISTSAPSDADMFSIWCDDAIRSGDKSTVCHVYKADEGCDLLDREQWKKANPALGIFRSEKDLETQLTQASRLPSMEAMARNLMLNQRVALNKLWLAPGAWKSCGGPPDMNVFRTGKVAIGLDLSMRNDLTAAVLAGADAEGIVSLFPFVFTPAHGVEERSLKDRAPYAQWVKDGYMFTAGGNTLEYGDIARILKYKLAEYEIEPTNVCFDAWRMDVFKPLAEKEGLLPLAEWTAIGQGFKSMTPRVDAFEAALLSGKIRHGNHPLLSMAAANAIMVQDAAGNKKLDKAKSTMRIDPLVAAVMAVFSVTDEQTTYGNDVSWLVA